uniref:Endothelin-converting enzyme 1 n=1 Tax=Hemiselmis tepida TaxID=464990 RepID=A0A7S0VEH4_9CRYP|mmetsp:Transcript_1360/g.3446  ORF Transcript_1360/g.3446 Transcript_1360/m.3446 type:complete len:723 (+) Transcript_1360:198-2366(+)
MESERLQGDAEEGRYDAYGTVPSGTRPGGARRKLGGGVKCVLLGSTALALFLITALWVKTSLLPSAPSGETQLRITGEELAALPPDVRAALDESVDPCHDFYRFSCGGWEAKTRIPAWQSSWAKQWDGVTTRVEKDTVHALQEDKGPAGTFYRSCMETDRIQKLGGRPLEPWMRESDAVVDRASLVTALARFAVADMNAFFSWWVDADSEDSSVYSFFLAQGGITMPDRSYYLDPSEAMGRHRAAYRTMVENIMLLSGRNGTEARRDADNVMAVETRVARAMTAPAQERDEHGKRMTVAELSAVLPFMDWQAWFKMLGVPDVGTEKGGFMVVKNVGFLRQLDGVMRGLTPGEMRSYLRWQAAYNFAPFLSFKFEDELVRYNHDLYGISHLPPRWRKCYFAASSSMNMEVSKLFVDLSFPESSRAAALEMLREVRAQFNSTLGDKRWMDQGTRDKAKHKLAEMFLEVGHPTAWPPSTFETYGEFGGIKEDSLYGNVVATNAYDVKRTLARLATRVERRRWGSSAATDVNSFYSRKVNGIFIPAGILQPPFYSPEQATARNYGSVGAICGHEMSHGFDDIGREYDADGNRNGWWTPKVVKNFEERASCISGLFSSYSLDGRHVNGKLTLGEAIADSGGVKFSWEAFLARHDPTPEEKRLFFIAMGQTWCQKEKAVSARADLLSDQHPPAKFRVIGTLSQFPPFSDTFRCPVGSPMNPPKRCHLW